MKNNDFKWYQPLSVYFQEINGAMTLKQFASIEAVLYLLSLNAPSADPTKAYLLFAQYQLIGTTKCSAMEHILQCAKYELGPYRSQKYWQDALEEYQKDCYDAYRAFSIKTEKGKSSFIRVEDPYPYPFEERMREWGNFWPEHVPTRKCPERAGEGIYRYVYQDKETGEIENVSVKLNETSLPSVIVPYSEKGPRLPITVSLEELLDTAKQMAEISPGDPCHTILEKNVLKHVEGSSVRSCTELSIDGVANVVGMVGSGKSTLIKVLSFWCHKNAKKLVVVVDTVAEVLNLQKYLSILGVKCSPLIGRGERLKYINQVVQQGEMCLSENYSQYLTPVCLIDGMDSQRGKASSFGQEPCYSLKKNGMYLCPYFDVCQGTRMLRECYEASVVITTVAGLAASRVGHTRETFLELAMREFDLVIFDESDRVQKTLDHFFMPDTSFNDYIKTSAEDCAAYMKLSSKRREENLAIQRYDEMQRQSVTVLSCIVNAIKQDLGSWKRIAHGDPFSALTLLEDLFRENGEYALPLQVYQEIYDLIDMHDREHIRKGTLWMAMESSCKSTDEFLFNLLYERWLNEIGKDFPRPSENRVRMIQDARIKLILKLIYFDHYIRDLSSAYEACHETSYGLGELFSFLQTRFVDQQNLLPSALCGNLFGIKKTDEDDIILFRQFACGRSLMKDLPYLRTDADGNAAGPHVMLLSGSSWAKGSYEYHVNRPVDYILEADSEKRAFLEKTRFFESGFLERVSGSGSELRVKQLRLVTQKAVDLIVRESERNAGKILLVVNSYEQAEIVASVLETALPKVNCQARVCCMISDSPDSKDGNGTIRRGEVSRFAKMAEDILIAPALAIERGHNIVDEYGHSALGSVFFMVRPMAVPDDIQQEGSKLNGFVEANCKRAEKESIFEYNLRVRQFAAKQWAKITKSKSFGLADLDENERRDVVATLFVLILQIFGRLARVTDVSKPEPHVYFVDGAFRGREDRPDDFDCLSELGTYLEDLMTQESSKEIAETLYAPFYKAYRKDIQYER